MAPPALAMTGASMASRVPVTVTDVDSTRRAAPANVVRVPSALSKRRGQSGDVCACADALAPSANAINSAATQRPTFTTTVSRSP